MMFSPRRFQAQEFLVLGAVRQGSGLPLAWEGKSAAALTLPSCLAHHVPGHRMSPARAGAKSPNPCFGFTRQWILLRPAGAALSRMVCSEHGNRLKENHGPGQGLAWLRESILAADGRTCTRMFLSDGTARASAPSYTRTFAASAAKTSFCQPRRSSPPEPWSDGSGDWPVL